MIFVFNTEISSMLWGRNSPEKSRNTIHFDYYSRLSSLQPKRACTHFANTTITPEVYVKNFKQQVKMHFYVMGWRRLFKWLRCVRLEALGFTFKMQLYIVNTWHCPAVGCRLLVVGCRRSSAAEGLLLNHVRFSITLYCHMYVELNTTHTGFLYIFFRVLIAQGICKRDDSSNGLVDTWRNSVVPPWQV